MVDFGPYSRAPVLVQAEEGEITQTAVALMNDPESINSQDPATLMTALHWAGANRNLELARLLFAQTTPKADPWIKDRWGRLAVDLAIETGNETLIDLFHRQMFPEDYEYDFDPLDPPPGATVTLTPKPGL